MKNTTLIAALLIFAGCQPDQDDKELSPPMETASHPFTMTNRIAPVSVDKDALPETWMKNMQIWQCDDGTFELKAYFVLRGKYATASEARAEKTNWAAEMVAAYANRMARPAITNCGKRIE